MLRFASALSRQALRPAVAHRFAFSALASDKSSSLVPRATREPSDLKKAIALACSSRKPHLFWNLFQDLESSLNTSTHIWAMPGINADAPEERVVYAMTDIKALTSEEMNMILHANRSNLQVVTRWHTFLTSEAIGVRGDSYTFPILINAHLYKRDIAGATRWLDLMYDLYEDSVKSGEGAVPNQQQRRAYKNKGRSGSEKEEEKELELRKKAQDQKRTDKKRAALSVAANSILRAYGRTRVLKDTEKFFRRIFHVYKLEPDIRTVTIMINSYGHAQDLANASRWFNSIHRKYKFLPDHHAYCALLYAHAEVGNYAGAWKILQEMKKEGIPADLKAYNIVMLGAKKSNRWHEAVWFHGAMIADGIVPDSYTYSALINTHAAAGRAAEAIQWFEKMQEMGLAPEQSCMAGVLNALAFVGDIDASIAWMVRIQNEYGIRINTIYVNILLKALTRTVRSNTGMTDKQRVDIAIKIWNQYLVPGTVPYNSQTYCYLILACKGANEEETMKMTEFWFNQMLCNKPRVEPEQSLLDLVRNVLGKERFDSKLQQIMNEPQVLQSLEDLEKDIAL